MKKIFFVSLLFSFCFLLFETSIVSNLTFLPAFPDFLLIILIYFSLHNGQLLGESNGFVSGLMLDFFTAAPLGFNCLLRTILGWIFGLFHNIFNTRSVLLQAAYGFVGTIIKAVFVFLISLFFKGVNNYSIFSQIFLTEALLNAIFTPILFIFLNLFSDFLIIKPEKNL
ncbi:MAG: rod shape-determining protein MreD [Treponemataceae bacterium]